MSKAKSGGADSASAASASSSLTKILDVHERMETQCGEIYVQFAAAFSGNPELRRMWTAMALEEGGHAAMVRAVSKGLVSGMLSAKPPVLPFEYVDSLSAQLKEYQRRADEGVPLDQALRITWELECSELDFMREMLVSASNLASLGFPTSDERRDEHVGRLRRLIQKHATDEAFRREVKFVSSELLRPASGGHDE
jgi:rubrerythrin